MSKKREVNVIVDAKNKSKGAFVEIKKDLKQLGDEAKKGIGTFSNYMGKADKVVMSFADRMQFMDKIAKRTFQGTAAAAGIYMASTLRDFSQLNDGISRVNTLYDQTTESQRKMYQDSIRMFKMLPTNFNEITQGIYDTISAGADPKYATMYARKFGMAGVAGDADMDIVTKAAMGTMNAFKLEAKDLNRILDLQFMTVKDGITSYSELASSLGTGVLASAKSSGITLEELYGSIAMITKNAIPANIATTSLNQLFNKFTDTKAIKEFKKFGVQIQDSKKNTRPLIEILKDLNYQFDKRKMTSEQSKGYLKELLGSDEAARAILPLLSDMKEFQKILGDMDNSSGAMRSAYDDRLDNMKTQIEIFWNVMKATGVEQIYSLKPLMDTIMEPLMKRQKLEIDIQDLEDALELMNDPVEIKLTKREIIEMEKELNSITIAPVDDFREALSKSVDELNKFSPAVGNAVDKLGNFILGFMGEEGKENRDLAINIGKGVLATQILSWGSRRFKDFTGKTPWEAGAWLIPKLIKMGVSGMETAYLQALYAMDALTAAGYSFAGVLGGIALPLLGAGSVLYNEKKVNDRAKEVIENPDNYRYSFTEKKWLSLEELDKLNKKKMELDTQNNVTIGAATGKNLRPAFPKKETQATPGIDQTKEVVKLMNTSVIDELLKINQLQDKINNTINMQSQITVEPPNVEVYVDSKQIPIQRVEVGSGKINYRDVEKQSEIQARRYGRPDVMSY